MWFHFESGIGVDFEAGSDFFTLELDGNTIKIRKDELIKLGYIADGMSTCRTCEGTGKSLEMDYDRETFSPYPVGCPQCEEGLVFEEYSEKVLFQLQQEDITRTIFANAKNKETKVPAA